MAQTTPQEIPAGAVDLSAVKLAKPEEAAQFWNGSLMQANLICQCGAKVRSDGWLVYIRREGEVKTPKGAMPGLGTVTIHSVFCPIFFEIVLRDDVQIVAMRRITTVEWADEIPADVRAEYEGRAKAWAAAAQFAASKASEQEVTDDGNGQFTAGLGDQSHGETEESGHDEEVPRASAESA